MSHPKRFDNVSISEEQVTEYPKNLYRLRDAIGVSTIKKILYPSRWALKISSMIATVPARLAKSIRRTPEDVSSVLAARPIFQKTVAIFILFKAIKAATSW